MKGQNAPHTTDEATIKTNGVCCGYQLGAHRTMRYAYLRIGYAMPGNRHGQGAWLMIAITHKSENRNMTGSYWEMENAHHPPDDPGDHFCFGREEIGHLTGSCILDRLATMTRNERDIYEYCHFLPSHDRQRSWLQPKVDPDWRASIVKWVSAILLLIKLFSTSVSIHSALFIASDIRTTTSLTTSTCPARLSP